MAFSSIARLCRFLKTPFDAAAAFYASRSPLEWPEVYTPTHPDPRRQRLETAALLAANGIRAREVAAVEPAATAESLCTAVAAGRPILLNAPGLPIVYGFDRRERDAWWWVSTGDSDQIVFESERMAQLVYWNDDPTAGVFWIIDGSQSINKTRDAMASDTAYLRTVALSVLGNPDEGVPPYPLSIRAMRDRFADIASPLALPQMAAASDPWGFYRAAQARESLCAVLQRRERATSDTASASHLRLAQYYFHHALQNLEATAMSLYGPPSGGVTMPVSWKSRSADAKNRTAAAAALTDLLRWEKQALDEIGQTLTVPEKKPPAKPVTPTHKRRRK